MFIREYKQTNKKTGATYVKHKLVASVWTEKGPRQKVIMPLGTLTIPRIDWKRLAHALECRITGQQSLLEAHDIELEQLALKLVSNNSLSKSLEILEESEEAERKAKEKAQNRNPYTPIDLDSVKLQGTRSLGAELLCMKAWEILGMTEILTKLRFSRSSISIAMVLLFGRMISPGSERHTIEWFRKRSALQELPGISDLSKFGKDKYYTVADELYDYKERIEEMLYQKGREVFPHREPSVYLYDITNTYLEGNGLKNELAARGHCKSKRYDCPLVTLSMVIGDDGMPVCSQIYKGNQSEPETMEGIMERLMHRLYGSQIPIIKPTVVMDRGIATDSNVKWLRANGYHYILIKRQDDSEVYRHQFENEPETFEQIGSRKSVYGDENSIYVRKELIDEDTCHILCISEGKAQKEKAIAENKKDSFVEDIERFRHSIRRGTIKKADKIADKLQRIIGKHGRRSAKYDVSLVNKEGKVVDIQLVKKADEAKPLHGCYVIESSHTDMSANELWNLYMTLTRVEDAFRSMKETLGMRPVYHHTANRTAAHLFITVLAYHLLAVIMKLMFQQGDTRSWGTLRNVMSTLMRGTVTMRDDQRATYSLRLSGEPEAEHKEILDRLGILSLPKTIKSKINTL